LFFCVTVSRTLPDRSMCENRAPSYSCRSVACDFAPRATAACPIGKCVRGGQQARSQAVVRGTGCCSGCPLVACGAAGTSIACDREMDRFDRRAEMRGTTPETAPLQTPGVRAAQSAVPSSPSLPPSIQLLCAVCTAGTGHGAVFPTSFGHQVWPVRHGGESSWRRGRTEESQRAVSERRDIL
jgi:hypothetical protein